MLTIPDFVEDLLVRGLLSPEQAQRIAKMAAQEDTTAIRVLLRSDYLDQQTLAAEIARYFDIEPMEDGDATRGPVLPHCISPRFMREHRILPLTSDDRTVTVAVSDPSDGKVISALRIATEREVVLRIATDSQIMSRIERLNDTSLAGVMAHSSSHTAGSEDDEAHLKDLALDAPVIDLVNRLFRDASAARATDLHIEPARGRVHVRRRIDGMLQDAGTLPPDLGRAAVSRVKILTHLNIAERRLPQDGRARVRAGDLHYDIRVATMPTIHGESIAIRFLSSTSQAPELGRLGLNAVDLQKLKTQAAHDHGMIIVTGPTGSGKTTTLAAVLDHLNDPAQKIVTIEDPVEYQIEGINQIQVHPEIGLTFAATLRSLLRLDPDVIMVGEMRDSETAMIGVNAALTGHLVLTTLHTNSAAGAITRLLDLGVQAYLVASTLHCVVAQRLVRRLCTNCRVQYEEDRSVLDQIPCDAARRHSGPLMLWRAAGCDHCNGTGYLGRAAIFEILVVDDALRKLIRPELNAGTVAAEAIASGMTTMLSDGFAKCLRGITTVEELGRLASED